MKVMIVLVVAILIVVVVMLFWPSPSQDWLAMSSVSTEQQTSSSDAVTEADTMLTDTSYDELKYTQMIAEYGVLETSRKRLKRKLSRLNYELWGQTFPKEMAKEFNEIMLNAYKLVKNPDQLGAFSSVKGIKHEIDRVRFADKSLDGVNTSITALKEKSGG